MKKDLVIGKTYKNIRVVKRTIVGITATGNVKFLIGNSDLKGVATTASFNRWLTRKD